ncbi:hypothetical protein RSAG8_11666, partial [Rhizoctonia solani AG-8 WAC10335]
MGKLRDTYYSRIGRFQHYMSWKVDCWKDHFQYAYQISCPLTEKVILLSWYTWLAHIHYHGLLRTMVQVPAFTR